LIPNTFKALVGQFKSHYTEKAGLLDLLFLFIYKVVLVASLRIFAKRFLSGKGITITVNRND